MPFTLSHAVLAPPLARLSRHTLPIGALAIGCMTPDLVRLFTNENVTISHEWAGLIIPNLCLGLIFCLLWYLLYRPALYCWLALQDDLNLATFNQFCGFCIACIAGILIGCATHIIWDGLTHDDFRTFAFQHLLSYETHFLGKSYPVHRLLQLGMSILCLPLLFWMCYRYIQKHRVSQIDSRLLPLFFNFVLLLSLCTGGYLAFHYLQQIDPQFWQTDTYAVTGKAINYFSRGFLLSFSFACLIFIFLKRLNWFSCRE
ncbi:MULTISPECIES: DUF4184 family protein [unclassified Acinetobacter]|uniref:DUF4184 family protein n=1 Tax=unclassified Acinetobacter TaxID=196816 RepID=UPI001909F978|nr:MULTISPECIES: DUF4184 family protein [unclassified Acinetobacter]MBK0064529.1 DUF4184 family protein [Acinetobacter sp. S55]MBK0067924.1 DUF4184 family protein [Acinetobacter sp. S54]